MLESLKKKTLLGNLWCIIVLGIVTAALGVVFGSGIVKMLAGPAYFDPLDDHEDILSLQGQYITMDVDTLIDYYAETVRSESGKRDEVSAREYIMPINTPDATIYIGLEVPASKIDDAEAVVDDTARMLDDEDGNYEWDGSYVTVRGTLKRMDDETKQLWEDYFIDAGFSYDVQRKKKSAYQYEQISFSNGKSICDAQEIKSDQTASRMLAGVPTPIRYVGFSSGR